MKRWVDGWRSLSAEKKLTIVLIPIATTLIAASVPLLGGALSKDPVPGANVDVAEALVVNGPEALPEIQVLVRNTGERVAIIDRVFLTVKDFASTRNGEGCAIITSVEGIDASAPFDVVLPARPKPRTPMIDVPVARQLAPGEAEKIRIRVSTANMGVLLSAEMPVSLGASRLYRLEVGIGAGDNGTLSAGHALVAVPFPLPMWFANPAKDSRAGAECPRKNRDTLRKFLRLDGTRSPDLTDFAEDPNRLYVDRFLRFYQPSGRQLREARGVARQFLAALSTQQFTLACQMMSLEARASLHGSCPTRLRDELRLRGIRADVIARAEVPPGEAVRDGVRYSIPVDGGEIYTRVGQGRDWVVDGFMLCTKEMAPAGSVFLC